jgi:hypothetical protein
MIFIAKEKLAAFEGRATQISGGTQYRKLVKYENIAALS